MVVANATVFNPVVVVRKAGQVSVEMILLLRCVASLVAFGGAVHSELCFRTVVLE